MFARPAAVFTILARSSPLRISGISGIGNSRNMEVAAEILAVEARDLDRFAISAEK
jgi:hypothetical protein